MQKISRMKNTQHVFFIRSLLPSQPLWTVFKGVLLNFDLC